MISVDFFICRNADEFEIQNDMDKDVLIQIVSVGAGLVLNISDRPVSELEELAVISSYSGAKITFRHSERSPGWDLLRIAHMSPGNICFEFSL